MLDTFLPGLNSLRAGVISASWIQKFFFFYLGLNGWVGISQVEKGEEHSIQKEQPQA